MTKKEFVEKVLATVTDAEMVEFAEAWLAKDAADKEKAKVKRAEKAAEGSELEQEFMGYIKGIVGTEPMTRAMILEDLVAAGHDQFGEKALTGTRVSTICNKMVEAGVLTKETIKVDAIDKNGKATKNAQAAYALA